MATGWSQNYQVATLLASGTIFYFQKLHASTMGLTLKTNTEFDTPQFHVDMDELFSTVPSSRVADLETSLWTNLCHLQSCCYIDDDDPSPRLPDHWLTARKWLTRERKYQADFFAVFISYLADKTPKL